MPLLLPTKILLQYDTADLLVNPNRMITAETKGVIFRIFIQKYLLVIESIIVVIYLKSAVSHKSQIKKKL